MKRLMILTMVAVLAVPLAGCSRGWPRWWGCRGDPCTTYSQYESLPAVTEQVLPAPLPAPQTLPGPETQPST